MFLLIILVLILMNIYFKEKKYKINLYPVIILLLILFSGLKSNYGFDYNNYLIHFGEINSLTDFLNTNFEKGYSFLILIFKNIGLGFNTFLLFISFFSIKMKEKVFNELSVMPEVSLLLYFMLFYVFNDVEQIRHGISIGFCFYSLIFLNKVDAKSKIYSFILMIFGFLFHTSALLFFPIYFIKDRLFNKKTYIIVFVISILLSFINYFDLISLINNCFIHSTYLTDKIHLYTVDKQSLFTATLLIKLFILLLFCFVSFDKNNKLHRLIFNIYYIGIIYTVILNDIPILVARGTTYMRYSELLMIPFVLSNIKNKEKANRKYSYFIVGIIFGYYLIKFISVLIIPEYFNYTSI